MRDFDPDNLILFGIGNSGRGDDGLGWKCLDMLRPHLAHIPMQYRYQLQIEDAELASEFSTVVFIDSSKEKLPMGYSWERVVPVSNTAFTTHFLKPATILHLCKDLYTSAPAGYILGIQGYQWELGDTISTKALANLSKAIAFVENMIYDRRSTT